MINRNGVVATLFGLCALLAITTNSKVIEANAMTQKATQDIINRIKPIEGEILNPDISLSDEELTEKYTGKTYREVAQTYELKGYSEEELKTVTDKVENLKQSAPLTLTEEEKDLLYRLVFSEGGNQSYETQQYICSVVINRMRSKTWPNTIKEVIYQPFQFEVVSNGMIDWKVPTQTTVDAVNDVLDNGVTNDKIVSFRNNCYHSGLKEEFVSGILYFSSLY